MLMHHHHHVLTRHVHSGGRMEWNGMYVLIYFIGQPVKWNGMEWNVILPPCFIILFYSVADLP